MNIQREEIWMQCFDDYFYLIEVQNGNADRTQSVVGKFCYCTHVLSEANKETNRFKSVILRSPDEITLEEAESFLRYHGTAYDPLIRFYTRQGEWRQPRRTLYCANCDRSTGIHLDYLCKECRNAS